MKRHSLREHVGRAEVVLINPMHDRVAGAPNPAVPLGLEYMKQRLRENGFSAEVINLDCEPPGGARGRPAAAQRGATFRPLDAATLEARKRRVTDRRERWWLDFEAALRAPAPKLVGVSMVTPQFHAAATAARVARETIPGVRVVAGGIHPTVMPEDVLSTGLFDAVAVGEGENTILGLARLFVRGEGGLEDIDGICFLRDGAPARTRPVALIEDLDSLGFPERDCIVPPGARLATAGYSRH